jgi:tetratricopeptide (TPR) repeat protein
VALLEGQSFEASPLRAEGLFTLARALLRVQRSAEVVALLGPVVATFANVDEISTARMLHGTSVARAVDVDQGLHLLAATATFAKSHHAHRAIQVEVAYYRGLAYWSKSDFNEATRYALVAERAKLDILSVRALELRAFAALSLTKFEDALGLFERARQAYASCRGRDLDLATQIIHQIATLEMNLRSAAISGSHDAPGGRTIPGTSFGPAVPTHLRMLLLSADAWLYAHDGDRFIAFRKAYDALSIAPTPAWRVWALTWAAGLFQAFGEIGNAHIFAADAAKLAASVNWNATGAEERIGLLYLAEVFAADNSAGAPEMLQRYDAITSKMDPTRLLRDRGADPRLAGWDAHVRGMVARAAGDHETAGKWFRNAIALFQSCGYLWREALALIELDATPIDTRGESPLERAALIIRDNFPNSFLAARLGWRMRAYVDPVARELTTAERDVLRRLLEGHDIPKICQQTNRALPTVRKHIQNLHKAFGVRTTVQLMAACQHRGLGPGALTDETGPDKLARTS